MHYTQSRSLELERDEIQVFGGADKTHNDCGDGDKDGPREQLQGAEGYPAEGWQVVHLLHVQELPIRITPPDYVLHKVHERLPVLI